MDTWTERYVEKDMKLGKLLVPGGAQICVPILMLHHDQKSWGDDAKEFKPDRFSEGLSKASKGTSVAFFPFGWGPRICIGQNFTLLEAKLALSLILKRFSFELSPTYSHALTTVLTLQPQHEVQLVACEGDKWAKHRKIINPAFNLEQLKNLVPIFCQSCNIMI
ncbi:hypothetical protein K1719_034511 [Acacia pycnantha]|nr:hypothetical protein K1719_034511 [Acacia pycnantha]